MGIRSQPGVMRDTAILALAAGIKKFHSLHYDHTSRRDCSDRHVVNGTHSNGEEMMDLSDTDYEEEEEVVAPPPPPPPPPAPASSGPPPPPSPPSAPAPVSEDGVGQMVMMAKSRMHDELIRRARRNTSPEDVKRQATPPSPPLTPPGPCPPPPPPPPPPQPAVAPNMEDCVTQMTAMSKSKMHMELVS